MTGNDQLFIDLHTHIDQYEETELPGLLERAHNAEVGAIIASGVTVESTLRCLKLARDFDSVFAGVGVHPSDLTGELTQKDLDQLRNMATDEQVMVMSEVGLDYQEHSPDREMQERAFRSQLGIAHEAELPVVFHMRFATADMIRVLRDENVSALGGAAHYFQGNHREASAILAVTSHWPSHYYVFLNYKRWPGQSHSNGSSSRPTVIRSHLRANAKSGLSRKMCQSWLQNLRN